MNTLQITITVRVDVTKTISEKMLQGFSEQGVRAYIPTYARQYLEDKVKTFFHGLPCEVNATATL